MHQKYTDEVSHCLCIKNRIEYRQRVTSVGYLTLPVCLYLSWQLVLVGIVLTGRGHLDGFLQDLIHTTHVWNTWQGFCVACCSCILRQRVTSVGCLTLPVCLYFSWQLVLVGIVSTDQGHFDGFLQDLIHTTHVWSMWQGFCMACCSCILRQRVTSVSSS